jgi:hypothetical protein
MRKEDRAIAHAVSRQVPAAAVWVRAQVMWDLWWTKWHWGRFSSTSVSPCQFLFHRLLHTYHLSSGNGKIGQLVGDYWCNCAIQRHGSVL